MENNIRNTEHDHSEDDHALALANMIDDDQPIDWDSEAVVATSDDERAVLAELRVLAALTRVYRDPDASARPRRWLLSIRRTRRRAGPR